MAEKSEKGFEFFVSDSSTMIEVYIQQSAVARGLTQTLATPGW